MIDERKLIEKIKDWQEDIHDNEYNADKYDFVFERIYEILEEKQKISLKNKTSDWIPCSERLPEEYGWYLVTYDDGYVNFDCFYKTNSSWYGSQCGYGYRNGCKEIAWMPLPEPYKGEE